MLSPIYLSALYILNLIQMASKTAPSACVGPDYRSEDNKPKATISTKISSDNVHVLPQTPQLIALLTWVLRTRATWPHVLTGECGL